MQKRKIELFNSTKYSKKSKKINISFRKDAFDIIKKFKRYSIKKYNYDMIIKHLKYMNKIRNTITHNLMNFFNNSRQ